MNVYETKTIKEIVKDNSYVGRGLIIGKTKRSHRQIFFFSMRKYISQLKLSKMECANTGAFKFPDRLARVS